MTQLTTKELYSRIELQSNKSLFECLCTCINDYTSYNLPDQFEGVLLEVLRKRLEAVGFFDEE